MRSIAIAVVMPFLLLSLGAPARAAWTRERVLALDSAPRAAVEGSDGGLLLLAGARRAERLAWDPGAVAPQREVLADPFPAANTQLRWAVNRRGDVLLAREPDFHTLSVLAIDASGERAAVTTDLGREQELDGLEVSIGSDGTSAVAWMQRDERQNLLSRSGVSVRVRAPGGTFGPTIDLPAGGPVQTFLLSVRPDGVAEVVYAGEVADRQSILRAEVRAGASPTAPELVATTDAPQPFLLDLVPGGPGQGRVVFNLPPANSALASRIAATLKTGTASWSPPQIVAPGTQSGGIVAMPNGSAALAYGRGRGIFIARAPPGAPFGAAVRVGRARAGWTAYPVVLSVSQRGDLLLAWLESLDLRADLDDCGVTCFSRVVAVVAPPGGQFGPPERVSSLGSVVEYPLAPIGAISSRGESVIAWQESNPAGEGRLLAVHGDQRPAPAPAPDRRRPHVTASTTIGGLREAARRAQLRVLLRCDEPCAVHIGLQTRARKYATGVYDLPPAVVSRRGAKVARWRLSAADQRELRRLLRDGRLVLTAIATDQAGNLRRVRRAIR